MIICASVIQTLCPGFCATPLPRSAGTPHPRSHQETFRERLTLAGLLPGGWARPLTVGLSSETGRKLLKTIETQTELDLRSTDPPKNPRPWCADLHPLVHGPANFKHYPGIVNVLLCPGQTWAGATLGGPSPKRVVHLLHVLCAQRVILQRSTARHLKFALALWLERLLPKGWATLHPKPCCVFP